MIPEHIHYWRIEHVWAFYIIACLAVALFILGLITHVSVWLKGAGHRTILFSWHGLFNLFLDGLFGRRIFKGDIAAGTMHLFILWGFSGLFDFYQLLQT